MAETNPLLFSLILQQLAPWLGRSLSRASMEEAYQTTNLESRSVFVYRIADGEVALLEKPGFTVRTEFHDASKGEPEGRFVFREEYIRANMYREFFARVLQGSPAGLETWIAIDVGDRPMESFEYPLFSFQKLAGGRTVLIPDVDFLHSNFYIPAEFRDETPYEDKRAKAVFAGSTTAGRTISAEDVRNGSIPRLRAGVFFRGNPHVDFRVPRIVQCESDTVVEMVRALGINAEPMNWAETFENRFILSMDGNGATCSRVAIGLASQCALMKYDSPCELYYMGALTPWRHYIPIASDGDVAAYVEMERSRPLVFKMIADESRDFARRWLSRAAVCDYTFDLLMFLDALTSQGASGGSPDERRRPAAEEPLVEVGAHVQNVGDAWGWPGEWMGEIGSGRAIEAIAIVPTGIPKGSVSYRVLLNDGSLSNPCDSGAFCGTRGRDWPLRGFELSIHEDWADKLSCSYQGHFADGAAVGPLSAGALCHAPSGAPLEAFFIDIRRSGAEAGSDPSAGDEDLGAVGRPLRPGHPQDPFLHRVRRG